ncbi:arylesterase [Kangiella koreensis]|uniref:Lipolytic protein G-D-S-L family n=1 Tax=Kangiella koreensis (strain DSM 16069 / JCM 12317 / KCTC 12182 / SW-125) TaxID=523791 RepID=C7R907_KANKD|nr:arylesterase [Kangiella koreensis]ACV27797.1 lipolytic protein G-D-S-L family [Kangiella koreensis DSM 16069]
MAELKKYLCLTLILVGSVLLTACSDPKLQPLSSNATIVAFGDSLTEGIGASKEGSYPSQLAMITGLEVVNAGISGETTDRGLARFEDVLMQYNPELVILLEGGNDILRNHNQNQTKQNLAQMIDIAKQNNVQVLLMGVPEKNLFSSVAGFYDELAEEHQVAYMRGEVSDLLKTKKYKSDQIHLNAQGYRVLAEKIAETLKDEGALP